MLLYLLNLVKMINVEFVVIVRNGIIMIKVIVYVLS